MVDRPTLNLYNRDVKTSKLYSLFSLPIQPSVSPDSSPTGMSSRRYQERRLYSQAAACRTRKRCCGWVSVANSSKCLALLIFAETSLIVKLANVLDNSYCCLKLSTLLRFVIKPGSLAEMCCWLLLPGIRTSTSPYELHWMNWFSMVFVSSDLYSIKVLRWWDNYQL